MNSLTNEISKLVIGTAQYGMDYGIANKSGQISDDEMYEILNLAKSNKINTIDTAIDYGECENRLGELGIDQFNVITKISNLKNVKNNFQDFMIKNLEKSIEKLKSNQINTFLLHTPDDLLTQNKYEIYESLKTCKDRGLCKKIGVSCYEIKQVKDILSCFDIDVVQFPLNVLNTQLIDSGLLENLKKKKVEIHVRSIFLQGLLLMTNSSLNNYFENWDGIFQNWEKWINENNMSKLEACLLFVFSIKSIDKYIVGIDSFMQLKQIINILKFKTPENIPSGLSCNDDYLTNPSKWNLNQK